MNFNTKFLDLPARTLLLLKAFLTAQGILRHTRRRVYDTGEHER